MLMAYIRRDVISCPKLFYCLPKGRGGGDGELQIQPCEHLENEMHWVIKQGRRFQDLCWKKDLEGLLHC